MVVRNLHFAEAFDCFPAWGPKDNANGEWNWEYDSISLRGATHVWIDHFKAHEKNSLLGVQ